MSDRCTCSPGHASCIYCLQKEYGVIPSGGATVPLAEAHCPYIDMGTALGHLVSEKNAAYGSAFDRAGRVLNEMYPNGIRPDQYADMLGVVRILDKLFRIAAHKGAFGESPFKDIGGYGILGAVRHAAERDE